MKKVDWNKVKENEGGEYSRPDPGGYIARIISVQDVEEKEYIRVEWDFEEGEFKGYNADVYVRANFWPIPLIKSYKEKALPFFKAFKTALEVSNQGYVFREEEIYKMESKLFGVILGEEEYIANNGNVKTRLYVYQTRSVKAIRDGDYKVPELKCLKNYQTRTTNTSVGYSELENAENDLPF